MRTLITLAVLLAPSSSANAQQFTSPEDLLSALYNQ